MIDGKFGVFRETPDCPPPPPNSPRPNDTQTSHGGALGVDDRGRSRTIDCRCRGGGAGGNDARCQPDRTAADNPRCKSGMDDVKCTPTRLFRWLDQSCSTRRFADDQKECSTAVSESPHPIKARMHRRRRYRTS